jgi:hypothetical protein
MVLSEILSFVGGIAATIVGVVVKTSRDQARKKRDEVYKPIFNEIVSVSKGNLTIEDGQIVSIWDDFDQEKKHRMSDRIVTLLEDYAQHLEALNRLLRKTEKVINQDIGDEDGILPKKITSYLDQDMPNNQIVYSRFSDGSIEKTGSVNGLITIAGSELIHAEDAEELEERLWDNLSPEHKKWVEDWDRECFEGLLRLRSQVEENSINRNSELEDLNETVEDLIVMLNERMSVWKLTLYLD